MNLTYSDPDADPLAAGDDLVAPFQIEGEPVRGRIARFGPATVDEILARHDYHPVVGALLGELLTLAALVGSSLKFDGKLIVQVQAESDVQVAPIRFMVAEYRTNGSVRGYANVDGVQLAKLLTTDPEPALPALVGHGVFAMTIDQGADMDRYQGAVALEGDDLAEAAGAYFAQSEQIATRIRLACARTGVAEGRPEWRAGGALFQQVAGDSARGDSDEAWRTASILFESLRTRELLDPDLSAGGLLYRLFHEDGVRLFEAKPVETACTCSRARIMDLLRQFGPDAAADMIEADGLIRVRCEYCNKSFDVRPDELR
jgi:molecular chaperone Hsp33